MSRRTTRTLIFVAGLALVAPGSAEAAKRTVFMGVPPANQRAFQRMAVEVNQFFPSSITVRRGDTVAFTPVGFHTVDFPPRGGSVLPVFAPAGSKVAGVNDALGAPFWFNGLDNIGFNRLVTRSNYGKTLTLRFTRIESGLPLGNRLKPMNVRFPRTGRFTYFCDVHLGMRGTVRVVGRSRRAHSARAVAARVRTQVAAARSAARRLDDTRPPANTVSVGATNGRGVELMDFVPDRATVPVGTTVRFAMPVRSSEDHTATTGPGNPIREPRSYLGTLAASLERPVVDPRLIYPSERPPALASLTPQLHGNGFWNSGVMDVRTGSPPPPFNAVTFAAAGTYRFFCLIHPFMEGTVTAR